jgi:HD-like signal output (HDOD) protein
VSLPSLLFAEPKALPTVPRVVQQLIESFAREDVSIDDLAAQLSSDPVLSAKTLRLANSAYFHVSRQISTVDDALRMLGFVMVRNLVLGAGMAGAFRDVHGFDLPLFWRYSARTAASARWIAQQVGQNAELAFTVGLTHGLGHLVLRSMLPKAVSPLDADAHPFSADRAGVELAALGYHHGDVGAELARRWKFPADIADAIALVPDAQACSREAGVAATVHVAAWRARAQSFDLPDDVAMADVPAAVARAIGLELRCAGEPPVLETVHGREVELMPAAAELAAGLESMFD